MPYYRVGRVDVSGGHANRQLPTRRYEAVFALRRRPRRQVSRGDDYASLIAQARYEPQSRTMALIGGRAIVLPSEYFAALRAVCFSLF